MLGQGCVVGVLFWRVVSVPREEGRMGVSYWYNGEKGGDEGRDLKVGSKQTKGDRTLAHRSGRWARCQSHFLRASCRL